MSPSPGVLALDVSTYLPLNMSPEIERQIERVMILARKPVMTRPIALAMVLDALPEARRIDQGLSDQVEQYLETYMNPVALTQLRGEIAVKAGESSQLLPNQHGRDVDSSWQVSGQMVLRSPWCTLISLGGIAYDGDATPAGTMLSIGIDYAQVDIGYRDHWLSPFTDSSMLISTEATTMPSITLSSYRPFTGLGLSYQVFLAEMSESSRISCGDGYTTGNPKLAGLHLEAEPVSGFAIGINRQLQYSGGERGRDGFGDFVNALFNPSKYDNVKGDHDNEFGNQQASITACMIFPGRHPFSVYYEYAGEDTRGYRNYLLGNTAFSLGIDLPLLWDRLDLTYETTEWQNAWYVHHIYQDGLVNDDDVTGHWFGDQRRLQDAVGGNSHMLRMGWQMKDGPYLRAVYRTLKNGSYSAFEYHRMHELALGLSNPWKGHLIGLEVTSGQDIYGDWYARVAASLDLRQGRLDTSQEMDPSVLTDDPTEFFMDMGVTGTYLKRDRRVEEDIPEWTYDSINPHLGVGIRRTVSDHNDLGVRIEWDRAFGHDLLSARIADYRYRINGHYAMNGFFGIGRYQYNTPAYGWYMGLGTQVLDVRPKWDLCLDSRLHFKNVRDKVLESDPEGVGGHDYFNFINVTIYLSRRW